MKLFKKLPIVALCASFFFMNLGLAQTQRTITLYVNTADIQNPDINMYCNFGQAEGITNEEYTINANVGDEIVWRGVPQSGSETSAVEIVAINHEGSNGGRDIFGGDNRLRAENGEVSGTIVAATDDGADYKYKISFRVIHNGERRGGNFQIDPKIKVK